MNEQFIIEQLKAVHQTYVTRRVPMKVFIIGGVAVALAFFAIGHMMQPRGLQGLLPISLTMFLAFWHAIPLLATIGFLAFHAKYQFAHPRSRLTPQFAGAHLGYLAGWLLLVLTAYPVMVSLAFHVSMIGMVSYCVLLGTAVVWTVQSNRSMPGFAIIAFPLTMMVPRLRDFWLFPHPDQTLLHAAIIGASWLALAIWLRRLSRMTEEGSDYATFVPSPFDKANTEARRGTAKRLYGENFRSQLIDWWHDRLATRPATDQASRQRLFRYGFTAIPLSIQAGTMVVIMLGVASLMMLSVPASTQQTAFPRMAFQFYIFAIIGPEMVGKLTFARRDKLSQELLMPLSRAAFVDGMFKAIAVEASWVWGAVITSALLIASVSMSEQLTLYNVTLVLMSFTCIQPLLLGSTFEGTLAKSGMMRSLVSMPVLFAAAFLAGIVIALGHFVSFALAVAAAAAVVGLGLRAIRHARKRWMQAEMGAM